MKHTGKINVFLFSVLLISSVHEAYSSKAPAPENKKVADAQSTAASSSSSSSLTLEKPEKKRKKTDQSDDSSNKKASQYGQIFNFFVEECAQKGDSKRIIKTFNDMKFSASQVLDDDGNNLFHLLFKHGNADLGIHVAVKYMETNSLHQEAFQALQAENNDGDKPFTFLEREYQRIAELPPSARVVSEKTFLKKWQDVVGLLVFVVSSWDSVSSEGKMIEIYRKIASLS